MIAVYMFIVHTSCKFRQNL